MQYLLNFITIRTTITSSHKPYRKTLAIGWEYFFQQFFGDLLKVETIVHLCHKENCFTSPFWADE